MAICILLSMLFFGLIIGGFASGNTVMGVAGIVLFVADIILFVFLIRKDSRKKEKIFEQTVTQNFNCILNNAEKLQRLNKNEKNQEMFSSSDVVRNCVNLFDALHNLPAIEYAYVKIIFDYYDGKQFARYVNHKQYIEWCFEIISNFDMVVPYYKICGDTSLEVIDRYLDGDKEPFRKAAKSYMASGQFNSSLWQMLNKEFFVQFYAVDGDLANSVG